MAQPELFEDTFYLWLEANGVTFAFDDMASIPFRATVDLNTLKTGMLELINYRGGE